MSTADQTGKMSLTAAGLLVMVCFLWGGNSISIKYSNTGIGPLLAASIRGVLATLCLWAYAAYKKEPVRMAAGQRIHGVIIGVLFGLDFLFLYWGMLFTPASRATIFLYTHPFWVALGAHFLIPGDRLNWSKAIGLVLAFGGILAVFSANADELPEGYIIGDIMEMVAALFWAATTLYVKRIIQTSKFTPSHYQTLFAQLLWSIPVLALGALLYEQDYPINITSTVVWALVYQSFIVAFFSYLLWFWMIHNFNVSGLTAFSFLAPLFGVIMGVLILGEPASIQLFLGIGLVGAGIYLVNR